MKFRQHYKISIIALSLVFTGCGVTPTEVEVLEENTAIEAEAVVDTVEADAIAETVEVEVVEEAVEVEVVEEAVEVEVVEEAVEVEVVEEAVEAELVVETVKEEIAVETLNGKFHSESNNYDDFGWKARISITFENDAIVAVDYDEINESGALKSKDEAYQKYYFDKTGVNLTEVYMTLEKNLIMTQTSKTVDSITSATIASNVFKDLAQNIIDEQLENK